MFERSELSEASAELIERSEKGIVEALARWEDEVRVGARPERIKIIMGRSPSLRGWKTKRVLV
jgi:hypothetical protein